ncbi:Protein CBG13842 [Caenorhabditis briggsae]|uniref:Protein CBG13842 n=1 Tax=Caenorhabditis briggsae TaxID=6238 RepID=A8XIU1_CAEBR|nr:Protein CBG13842 [Caenorhabditis briggsae]CAP32566.2 Protein CBG13842 [Caenorhabditis briggsae]
MERLIRYGSVNEIPFYNCSWKSSEEWNEMGLKRPIIGWFLVVFGGTVEILYLPILYIIFKTKLIKYACYKLIVFLALTDMSATVCSSIISGVLYIQGAVFCTYPTFEYIAGGFAINTWCMACAINIALFANRVCIRLAGKSLSLCLFNHCSRIWRLCMISTLVNNKVIRTFHINKSPFPSLLLICN